MRNTQATLYRIGKIFNYVFLGIHALLLVLSLIFMIVGIVNFAGDKIGVSELSSLISWFVASTFYFAVTLVFVILCDRFVKQTETDTLNFAPVIVLLVFGFLTWNLLFSAGSIVGIVAISKEKNEAESK